MKKSEFQFPGEIIKKNKVNDSIGIPHGLFNGNRLRHGKAGNKPWKQEEDNPQNFKNFHMIWWFRFCSKIYERKAGI